MIDEVCDQECMNESHAVVIIGGGPTGLMLAGELALARVDVAIVERRDSQELIGRRAGGLHARTIEVLDQRGIADRFLAQGRVMQVAVAWVGEGTDRGLREALATWFGTGLRGVDPIRAQQARR
jgi:2-polyprenyl-6-methoxyphenol hydroxylase-like FAD-dependent oxidoreductase